MDSPQESPLHTFHGMTFAGIPCAQRWCDFLLWERLLNAHPDLGGIMEIGTWQGGFSCYLAAQAYYRGLDFITYDATRPDRDDIPGFVRCNVWIDRDGMEEWIAMTGPMFLFCDGGNKPREARTFGPLLAPGSILVAHDYRTAMPEFTDRDAARVEEVGLVRVHQDWLDELGSASIVFQRTAG